MTQLKPSFMESIDRYLALKRSLGREYVYEESVLTSLSVFLAGRGIRDLDLESFDAWCRMHDHATANVRRNRQRIVRNACLYRQRSDPACFVPDQNLFPRPCPHAAPVIFGPVEIGRMLVAARRLPRGSKSPLRPHVARITVVLLYTAGLRRGELLRLTLDDVDLEAGTLRIRESKFRKSRTVPLSPSAREELDEYLAHRLASPFSNTAAAPLLCNNSRGQRAYTGTGITGSIKELFVTANVCGPDGRRPRVHDFRHSFAVQALLRWYREGADMPSKLPHLAMYMGHVSIVSTAYYLKLIPEVAAMASSRFETHYGYLINSGTT